MAKTFKSINDFSVYINKCLKVCMSDIGREVKDELQDYVMKNWYNEHTPTLYNRTYEFVESATFQVMMTSNKKIYCEVFFDPDKIKAMYDQDSFFNKHMSLGGEDITESLVGWIENGQKSSVYSYDGIQMIESTREWCRGNYVKLLKEAMFKRYGIRLQ